MTLDSNTDVASMIRPFLRELQNNSTTPTNYYSGSSSGDPSVYNFIAFLAWYIFLVLCCVVPTACAYRRRQRIASQRNRQEYLERMAAQGPLSAGSQANRDIVETDEARKERVQNLVEHLKGTTMVRPACANMLSSFKRDILVSESVYLLMLRIGFFHF